MVNLNNQIQLSAFLVFCRKIKILLLESPCLAIGLPPHLSIKNETFKKENIFNSNNSILFNNTKEKIINWNSKELEQIGNYIINQNNINEIENRKIFEISITINLLQFAELSAFLVLGILGTYYAIKKFKKPTCNCKLCLGQYKTLEKLGHGGNGEIFKVSYNNSIFILKQCKSISIDEAEEILNEAKYLRNLSHKNIVQYHDDFIHYEYQQGIKDPCIYAIIIMEYCEGGDLKELIDKRFYNNTPFSNEEIIDILIQLCEGLSYIHQKSIIHRDIKSQNVFFTKDGNLRIGDFGLARKYNKNKRKGSKMSKVGTDCYMAPEVLKNAKYGSPADIWSLGCVIMEILTMTFIWQYECSIAIEAMTNMQFIEMFLNEIPNDTYNYYFFKEILRKIFIVEPEKRENINSLIYKLKKEKKRLQNFKLEINFQKLINKEIII